MDILETTFWGNTLAAWLAALATTILVFLILLIAKRLLARKVLAWVKRSETDLDDLVVELFGRTWYLFLVSVALYAGSVALVRPGIEIGFRTVVLVLFLVQAGLWATGAITYLVSRQAKKQAEEDPDTASAVSGLGYVGKIILWVVVLLLALDNIPGVEVDTLIASLGIGGVAVALAVQNILGDLFASLSIILDTPFVVGDAINLGEFTGTVERIGLKSTRLRSLTREQIIVSNSDLLNSRIRNYKRMEDRRVVFSIGVTYQTPYEKLAQIPELLEDIIRTQPQTKFGRAHFRAYDDCALTFEIVYRILTSYYNLFMDIQQAINLELFRRFEEEGIRFAYPTQTTRMET